MRHDAAKVIKAEEEIVLQSYEFFSMGSRFGKC